MGVEGRWEQKGVSIHFHSEPLVFFSAYILIELFFLLVFSIIKESSVAFSQQAALQIHRPEIHGEIQEPA